MGTPEEVPNWKVGEVMECLYTPQYSDILDMFYGTRQQLNN